MANHEQNFKNLPILCTDPRWRPKFLDGLLKTEGDVDQAAAQAGVLPVIAYQAAYKDPDFAQDWEEVMQMIREKRANDLELSMTKAGTRAEDPDSRAGKLMLQGYRPARFGSPTKDKDSAAEAIRSVADMFRIMAEREKSQGRPPIPAQAERVIDVEPVVDRDVKPEEPAKPGPLITRRKKTDEEPTN